MTGIPDAEARLTAILNEAEAYVQKNDERMTTDVTVSRPFWDTLIRYAREVTR